MSSSFLSCCFAFGVGVLGQPGTEPSAVFPPGNTEPAAAPAPEVAPAQAPADSPPRDDAEAAAWRDEYTRARQQLVDGAFEAAAARFRELAARAPGPAERSRALELADIAATLGDRDERSERRPQDGPRSTGTPGARSGDEIASLYANAVLYGIGTGVFLAVHTEPETAAGGILPALALAGALGGTIAVVDRGSSLRYGVPQAIVSGMYIGLEEGIAWAIWNQARARSSDQWSEQTVATVIWGSATVGAIAGAAIGASYETTPGRASYVGSTALWGGAITGLLAAAVGGDDDYLDDRTFLGAAVGLNAGATVGVLTANGVSPSIARVRFLDLGGIAGGLLAGGLYISAANDVDDPRGLLGVTAIGMGAGLAGAALLTADLDEDRGPGGRGGLGETRFGLLPLREGAALGVSGTL